MKETKLNEEYVQLVKRLSTKDSKAIFTNSSIEHSVCIANEMFKKAKDEIVILSGSLSELYFDKIKDELKNAVERINRKGGVRIITVDDDINEPKTINLLKEIDNTGKLQYHSVRLNEMFPGKTLNHFYVIDKKAWRIEDPHNKDIMTTGKVSAKASFNNEEIGKAMQSLFDRIWHSSHSTC